ncbi:MAG: SsrA-binding protein SmpB [Planctomycetes bacterium]|nr:SsrA-binding protein SmpB [Planctomycetota bacterium]
MEKKPSARRNIARNKRALFDYEILERHECGIVLVGTEVKSLRAGKVSLAEAYGRFLEGELFLLGLNIAEYEHGNRMNHDPTRPRKLLLHRRELHQLRAKVHEKGLTVVPLAIYFKASLVKVELGLGRGKRKYDKREKLRKEEHRREIDRSYR